MIRMEAVAKGKVQGVNFRRFVEGLAARYAVNGTVRNLADGDVEIVAEGKQEALDAMAGDIRAAPQPISVTRLDIRWRSPRNDFQDFRIIR